MKTRTRKKPNTDHVVCDGAGAKCLHCGKYMEVRLPIDLGDFVAVSKAFVDRHARCIRQSSIPRELRRKPRRIVNGFDELQLVTWWRDRPNDARALANQCWAYVDNLELSDRTLSACGLEKVEAAKLLATLLRLMADGRLRLES